MQRLSPEAPAKASATTKLLEYASVEALHARAQDPT